MKRVGSGGKGKPALVKKLEGNRSRREIVDPMPAEGDVPLPPSFFTPLQKQCYMSVLNALPKKMLAAADASTMQRHAVAWAGHIETTKRIKRDGLMVPSKVGMQKHPLIAAQGLYASQMERAAGDLGLSPLARTRIGDPKRVDDDPMDLLMGPNGVAWSDLPPDQLKQ